MPALRIGRPRSPGRAGPEPGYGAWQAGIILGEAEQSIGRRPVLDIEKFLAVAIVVARVERVAERRGDDERRGTANPDEDAAATGG